MQIDGPRNAGHCVLWAASFSSPVDVVFADYANAARWFDVAGGVWRIGARKKKGTPAAAAPAVSGQAKKASKRKRAKANATNLGFMTRKRAAAAPPRNADNPVSAVDPSIAQPSYYDAFDRHAVSDACILAVIALQAITAPLPSPPVEYNVAISTPHDRPFMLSTALRYNARRCSGR